jgi:hypothetical protein
MAPPSALVTRPTSSTARSTSLSKTRTGSPRTSPSRPMLSAPEDGSTHQPRGKEAGAAVSVQAGLGL